MESEKYILSFTGVSLALSESIAVAKTYLLLNDWEAVEKMVKDENLIQARTKSSIKRVYQELWPRLDQLTLDQLELLVDGNNQEQKQILWYAVCQRYAFIREFAIEVIHEKFLGMDYVLTDFNYDAFFNRKADWHPELDKIKDSTRVKMKTQVFRMLREAGLITKDNMITPTSLSKRVVDVLVNDSHSNLQIFPVLITNHQD